MKIFNQAVLEDLENQKQAIAKAEELAKNPKAHGVEDPADGKLPAHIENLESVFNKIISF